MICTAITFPSVIAGTLRERGRVDLQVLGRPRSGARAGPGEDRDERGDGREEAGRHDASDREAASRGPASAPSAQLRGWQRASGQPGQGSDHVFTLVKLFIDSSTPSL